MSGIRRRMTHCAATRSFVASCMGCIDIESMHSLWYKDLWQSCTPAHLQALWLSWSPAWLPEDGRQPPSRWWICKRLHVTALGVSGVHAGQTQHSRSVSITDHAQEVPNVRRWCCRLICHQLSGGRSDNNAFCMWKLSLSMITGSAAPVSDVVEVSGAAAVAAAAAAPSPSWALVSPAAAVLKPPAGCKPEHATSTVQQDRPLP